jgi:hypothetical protein
MKMNGLYPAVFSHPANFTSVAWFKASASTHPPLMPVVTLFQSVINSRSENQSSRLVWRSVNRGRSFRAFLTG